MAKPRFQKTPENQNFNHILIFKWYRDQEDDRDREQRRQVQGKRDSEVKTPRQAPEQKRKAAAPAKAAPVVQKKSEPVRVTKQVAPKQVVSAPVQVTQNASVTNEEEAPVSLSAAQKKKDKKKKKKAEEAVTKAAPVPVVAAPAAKNNLMSNLAAAPVKGGRHGDDEWENVTGVRVKLSKEERKQQQRKDSLDDETSESDSDVEAFKRKQKQAKKEAPVIVEAPKPVEKVVNAKGPAANTRSKNQNNESQKAP